MKTVQQKRNLFLHARPRMVPAAALRLRLTWGLGGASALMVVVQLVTGILLNFSYEPSAMAAYSSVQHIHYDVLFGRLFRNLHHWAGHALIVIVFLHMLRVFLSSAFRGPRHLNWVIGLGLFFLILLANFSGYLLPWDQRAYWAVTIATSILEYLPGFGTVLLETVRGGSDVSSATLHIFHTLHSGVLPLLLLFFMTWHFWKIRRAGGLFLKETEKNASNSPTQPEIKLSARPHLFVREKAAAAVVMAALLYAAIFFNAPLGALANPGMTPKMVKAPWYFIGFQELLIHVDPVVMVLVLPLLTAFFLLFFPFIKAENINGNRLVA
ncbi:MAG: cytochrome b N-terminal domain-containing protein, partial [Deltaproteobacteria bacterium]|nr:cytochrome b N-terminal domain-containing protein [Deltaproteobacteria bacterium]